MFDSLGQPILPTEEEVEAAEQKLKDAKKKQAEVSAMVAEVVETKGWKAIVEYIDKTIKDYNCSPHIYSNNPNAAHSHSGSIFALEELLEWVKDCDDYVNKDKYDSRETDES